jgi:hypothetical protein
MACIGSTGETDDQFGLFCQKIDNFPFSFITPLGSDDDNIHSWFLQLRE